MHSTRADIVHPAHKENFAYYAGLFRCQDGIKDHNGWYVPIDRVSHSPFGRLPTECLRVLIYLRVLDLAGSLSRMPWLPFLVDCGSPFTILPRFLVGDAAFSERTAVGHNTLRSVHGQKVCGYRYSASLEIGARRLAEPAIRIGVQALIPEDWNLPYGLLGMDALEQICMKMDSLHCSFCPLGDTS